MKTRLYYSTKFKLPINDKSDSIKIVKTSDIFFKVPTSYCIEDNNLYIIDKFNNRILQYNKKNKLITAISNKRKNTINLVYTGSNNILQPFDLSDDLFSFKDLDKININNDNIYVESIIMEKLKGASYDFFSFILKYNKKGKPLDVIGMKYGKNRIYPFFNMVKYSIDNDQNIFVYSKNDEDWTVLKLDSKSHSIIYKFDSISFFQTNEIPKKGKETIVVEYVDNFKNGDTLLIVLSYYKNEIEYQKTLLYKLDIKNGILEKLFKINDEKLNLVFFDNEEFVSFWETESVKNDKENIILRVYDLSGNLKSNSLIVLDRSKAQWLNINFQADQIISGINIKNNKLNVVVWK